MRLEMIACNKEMKILPQHQEVVTGGHEIFVTCAFILAKKEIFTVLGYSIETKYMLGIIMISKAVA